MPWIYKVLRKHAWALAGKISTCNGKSRRYEAVCDTVPNHKLNRLKIWWMKITLNCDVSLDHSEKNPSC